MTQATLSSSHPMVDNSQEDKTIVNVASGSTTATGGTDLNEARPGTPAASVEEPQPVLSDEQQRVVDLALAGKSLFFTGSAGLFATFLLNISPDVPLLPGTGKSLTLKQLVRALRSRNEDDDVFVTASTGKRMRSIGLYC
jgi:hypothetical protein